MTNEQLHASPVGAYLWVYVSGYNTIDRCLGRVIEHPFEDTTNLIIIKKGESYGHPTVEEKSFTEEDSKIKFASCSAFDAEIWLEANAIEAKIKKVCAEREASFKEALGFSQLHHAATLAGDGAYRALEVYETLKASADDEIPF